MDCKNRPVGNRNYRTSWRCRWGRWLDWEPDLTRLDYGNQTWKQRGSWQQQRRGQRVSLLVSPSAAAERRAEKNETGRQEDTMEGYWEKLGTHVGSGQRCNLPLLTR